MSKPLSILLVEDAPDIKEVIQIQLKLQGHDVTAVTSGEEAKALLSTSNYDMYILDRMLPGVSGIELCQYIRNHTQNSNAPILLVTALTSAEQIVEGLDAGADDYITKPFDMNVLLARVRAQERRIEITSTTSNKDVIEFGPFRIDLKAHDFSIDAKTVDLTKSEFVLMESLLKNVGKVMSRDELVGIIQGDEIHVTPRTIDTHVFGLRKKMGNYGTLIETIRGIGYRINEKN